MAKVVTFVLCLFYHNKNNKSAHKTKAILTPKRKSGQKAQKEGKSAQGQLAPSLRYRDTEAAWAHTPHTDLILSLCPGPRPEPPARGQVSRR